MYTPKKPTQEDMVRTMLIEDRDDTIDYIRDQLSLNGLRSATQNLQAMCNIVYQVLASGNPNNIIDAYKIANTVSMGFHESMNIFQEIKRDSIEQRKGHLSIPRSVNLDSAYLSDKLTETKSDYLVEAIANMLTILNLTAHILSRKTLAPNSKHPMVACYILLQAKYEPCKDIVSSTNMNRIWNKIVTSATETISGPSECFMTSGESHPFGNHDIRFSIDGISVDDVEPSAKVTNRCPDGTRYCAMFYINLDAWLYFTESGFFSIKAPDSIQDIAHGKLAAPTHIAKALYQELVA